MAYNGNSPADNDYIAAGPAELRENFRALKDDKIVNAQKLQDLSPGNASGNIPVANGNLNVNLNAEKLGGNLASAFATAGHTHAAATSSSNGMMSNTDKAKLDTVAAGAEVNQNAFSNILVGSTTIQADGKTDTLEMVAGTNIALTPDATNDRVTIAHNTGDGNLHVPATGSVNNTKVLKAGSTAGSAAWGQVAAGEVSNTPAGNIAATTVQAALNELDAKKVNVSDVVTTVAAGKILKLDANAKLPASITGDAVTVGGAAPGNAANNVLRLDSGSKVPSGNLPVASASALGGVKIGANLSIDAGGVLSTAAGMDAGHSFATNGYQILSSGFILQWGQIPNVANGTAVTITFPIVFSNKCIYVNFSTSNSLQAPSWNNIVSSVSSTSATIVHYNGVTVTTLYWFAIGY